MSESVINLDKSFGKKTSDAIINLNFEEFLWRLGIQYILGENFLGLLRERLKLLYMGLKSLFVVSWP